MHLEKLKNYRPSEKEPFMNERQRELLKLVAKKLTSPSMLVKMPSILKEVTPYTQGNIGGTDVYRSQTPNLQVVEVGTPGVLRLSLRADSYAWKFVPIANRSFTDSGTDRCH